MAEGDELIQIDFSCPSGYTEQEPGVIDCYLLFLRGQGEETASISASGRGRDDGAGSAVGAMTGGESAPSSGNGTA